MGRQPQVHFVQKNNDVKCTSCSTGYYLDGVTCSCSEDSDLDEICDAVDSCPHDRENDCANQAMLQGHILMEHPNSGIQFGKDTALLHLPAGGLNFESSCPLFLNQDLVVRHISITEEMAAMKRQLQKLIQNVSKLEETLQKQGQ